MSKIKIIAIPPGFAPQEIREQWVGIEIPLSKNPIPHGEESFRSGSENGDGYQVLATEAIVALRNAGKNDAANFWKNLAGGTLVFKKDLCELVN